MSVFYLQRQAAEKAKAEAEQARKAKADAALAAKAVAVANKGPIASAKVHALRHALPGSVEQDAVEQDVVVCYDCVCMIIIL